MNPDGSRLNAAGDWYHKHVYGKIAGTTAHLTDTDFPVTDLGLPLTLYAPEGIILSTAVLAKILSDPHSTNEERVAVALSVPLAVGIAVGGVLTTYGINGFRTPLDQKLGLEPIPFDTDAELSFVVNELNQRQDAPQLSFQETALLAHDAVDTFVQKIDGYQTPSSKRAKQSRFGNLMVWKLGALGLMNPYLQEVVLMTDLYPEVIAHEFAHLKGLPQERFAQLVGVVAQIESENPSLQYLGYLHWLGMLMDAKSPEWVTAEMSFAEMKTTVYDRLREFGLNEHAIELMDERSAKLSDLRTQVRSYSAVISAIANKIFTSLPKGARERIPEQVYQFITNPEQNLPIAIRKMIMKLTKQGDEFTAYVSDPLMLLHAYRNLPTEEDSDLTELVD